MNAPVLQALRPDVRRIRVSARDGSPIDDWAVGDLAMPEPDAIDLWLFDLDADASPVRDAVARSLARGATAHRRLRQVLSTVLGCPDEAVELVLGTRGKPALRAARTPTLHFNASRSGGLALIALAAVEVGVDVERCAPRRGTGDADAIARLRCWTRHEAVAKAIGIGLSARFRPPLGADWGSVQYGASFWGWRDLTLPDDVAAVATIAFREGEPRRCG